MTTRILSHRTPVLALALAGWLGLAACSDSSTGPGVDDDVPADTLTPIGQLPPTSVTKDDLTPAGTVTETTDGYTVEGELTLATSDTSAVTLVNADLNVRFDDQGRVRSITGEAEIASPHERIDIEDPVRADLGFFPGWWLNENRDLPLVLQDDTDYFVFDFEARLQMNIATGETGDDATHPVSVQAPVGGRAFMVVDYMDPMYFVYGQQDLIGTAGTGWSLHQRIPFRPTHQVPEVEGSGAFDGGTIRTGSFPIFKILKVSGTKVDNMYTEFHLSLEDPLSGELRAGYRQGHDGVMEFDLGFKDMVGITLPLASASGATWYEVGTSGLRGYAYAAGETDSDFDWWPSFIPIKPASSLSTHSFLTDQGDFQINLEGTYGWEFPSGEQSLIGVFNLANDGMLLEGTSRSGEVVWVTGAHVTTDSTRAYVEPPQQLLDEIAGEVNGRILPRIEEAEAAWNDLQEATADYEFELSLRGIRDDIPPMVDEGRNRLTQGINSAIASQAGEIWYNDFRTKIQRADNVYFAQLAELRAAALNATDNATTRTILERELRELAARKIFTFTYSYRVLGVTVYSTTVTRRVLSDTQANRLIQAADNVHRITETSNIRVQMQQVYETVNERELFEDVRDDLENGLLIMRGIGELGWVVDHRPDIPEFRLYAMIDGSRYDAGTISALSIAEMMAELPGVMIEALRTN